MVTALKVARPIGRMSCILGDPDSGLIRVGNSDWVHIRLFTETGDYARALLPRSRTGTPPLPTVPPTPVPADWAWDDLFLPALGTPLYAVPMGNAGGLIGLLMIEISTLPIVTPVTP
jgi:hypothetical protein